MQRHSMQAFNHILRIKKQALWSSILMLLLLIVLLAYALAAGKVACMVEQSISPTVQPVLTRFILGCSFVPYIPLVTTMLVATFLASGRARSTENILLGVIFCFVLFCIIATCWTVGLSCPFWVIH